MNKIIKITFIAAMAIMLLGCGGNEGDKSIELTEVAVPTGNGNPGGNGGGGTPSATAAMTIGTPIKIEGGYSIVNASADASVDIIVIGNARTATLTSGTASIKRL